MSIKDYANRQIASPELQVAQLETILEYSRAFNTMPDLNSLLPAIGEAAIQLTGSQAAAVFLLDLKTQELYMEAMTTPGEFNRTLIPLEGSMAGWIIQNDEVLIVDPVQHEGQQFSEFKGFLNIPGQTVLGVPLKFEQTVIGVLEVFNKLPDTGFTNNNIYALNTLAAQAAVAIANLRRFEKNDDLEQILVELQKSLASMIGFSRLALTDGEALSERVQYSLQAINQESNRLTRLVDDFCDLVKLETGRLYLEKKPVDMHRLLAETLEPYYDQADRLGLNLSLQGNGYYPQIEGDTFQLKRAVNHLLDNAIKYNRPSGLVEVNVTYTQTRLQLSVRNTGPGISPDDLSLVFDKFYRGNDLEGKIKGAGLGLALTRQIIETHGGDIWVESQLGAECTFTFSLPVVAGVEV